MDMDGTKLHAWRIDWFRLWPDAGHVPKRRVPRFRPGTIVHGAVLMDDGDLVFNFDQLGLVRLDRHGDVVWRLPYQTHHSVCWHDSGNLWVCGQKEHAQPDARFPNRLPPFREYTILEVTPEGEIAEEWSVPELLRENGLTGLLHLGTLNNWSTQVRDDSLHLNDVEAFPDRMEEDFFQRGGVLVSLRNVNTVFVFNRRSREIKFICTGWFVRQHDPDFVDGNTTRTSWTATGSPYSTTTTSAPRKTDTKAASSSSRRARGRRRCSSRGARRSPSTRPPWASTSGFPTETC
jgi:hypothetical protein